jgi:hypothetical protein
MKHFSISVNLDNKEVITQTLQIVKYSAIAGFIATTTLLINLNNKLFLKVFKKKSKSYFWFFLVISVIPLLAFLYVFNAVFGKLTS